MRDIEFVLFDLLDAEARFGELDGRNAIDRGGFGLLIEQATRFAERELAPLNRMGDREGCSLSADAQVRTPRGFAQAYKVYCDSGWAAIGCAEAHGGLALPYLVNCVLSERFNAANQAWTMYSRLSQGAYRLLARHGAPALQAWLLPKLASGAWTGTMCLTEAHCGTDLGLIRCRAEPTSEALADGANHWLSGEKIFVSCGAHDLTDNIVHMVLARIDGAAAGSRGLTLFAVPARLPAADGTLKANGVHCSGIETKMGLHGSATCSLRFDRARAWQVGEAGHGLPAMFVMMNGARLGVAIQSLGVASAAYAQSLHYARQRRQGQAERRASSQAPDPLIAHADVRRMLLTQRAWIEGARALCYELALDVDVASDHGDAARRARAEQRLGLLTPVAKAFVSDTAFASINLALQIHGGHGYIRDTGIEQAVRDARVHSIYEGTNGIQGMDLLGRKLIGDQGQALRAWLDEIRDFAAQAGQHRALQQQCSALMQLCDQVHTIGTALIDDAASHQQLAGTHGTNLLRLLGLLCHAQLWSRISAVCLRRLQQDPASADQPFLRGKLKVAEFYYSQLLPEAQGLLLALRHPTEMLRHMADEEFDA